MSQTAEQPSAETNENLEVLTGKYLTFNLGEEEYAVGILKVREIIGVMDITPVPRVPQYIRGVINLRGKIIPVVALRSRFAMEQIEDTELTCIIVLELPFNGQNIPMGILVDSVQEVFELDLEHLADTPAFGAGINAEYLLGVGRLEQRVVMLLDVDRILNVEELNAVSQSVSPEQSSGGQA